MRFLAQKKHKIALIGAGNIGGTLAHLCLLKDLGDIVLFDVKEGLPQGKALDLMQSAALDNIDCSILGTNDYKYIEGANIVIVTAGSPRKPGMTRDDLLNINATVMNEVGEAIKTYCPTAFVICVTNPLDAMVYLLQHSSGLPDNQIIGMAGVLDSSRFRFFLADHFKVSLKNVDAFVLGGHGDSMVPLTQLSHVNGVSLEEHVLQGTLEANDLAALIQRTRMGGGEIVNLLKVGSAFYAPAASAICMAEAVLFDQHLLVSAASKLYASYGVKRPMFLGVPTVLSGLGVEKIIELPLTKEEQENLNISIKAVEDQIN
ncbi:malate dehydrogenase, partial [bacterium]|nr:malate dehydrogenase [bacterium]